MPASLSISCPDAKAHTDYAKDIKEIAKTDLRESYDNAREPCDGLYYYNIKYYGRHDPVLAEWWISRLKNRKVDPMKQLRCHVSYDNALDSLQDIDALYVGLHFGSLKRLWGLGCPDV